MGLAFGITRYQLEIYSHLSFIKPYLGVPSMIYRYRLKSFAVQFGLFEFIFAVLNEEQCHGHTYSKCDENLAF